MISQGEFSQTELQERESIYKKMLSLTFSGTDLGLSYKQLAHWNKQGLFYEEIPDGKWRSFDFIEALWILFALELRDYGFGLGTIKIIKKELLGSDFALLIDAYKAGLLKDFAKHIKGTVEGKSLNFEEWVKSNDFIDTIEFVQKYPKLGTNLAGLVDIALIKKSNLFIAFSKEGAVYYNWNYDLSSLKEAFTNLEFTNSNQLLTEIMNTSGVVISTNFLISKLIGIVPAFAKNGNPQIAFLTETEREILALINNTAGLIEVIVKMKDGKPIRLLHTTKVKVDIGVRLTDVFLRGRYEEITLKTEAGNIVFAQKTTSKLLK